MEVFQPESLPGHIAFVMCSYGYDSIVYDSMMCNHRRRREWNSLHEKCCIATNPAT